MTDVAALLARQARWQKSRASLPWPEKVRIAEQLREDVAAMRRTRPKAKRPDEIGPPR
jgi:hypothetical protein